MKRKIVIGSCSDCPNLKHSGGFGGIAYIPICHETGEMLPYTKSVSGNRIVATATGEIPDWCPLDAAEDPL